MASAMMHLTPRHIQNMSEATAVTHHWGYGDRMVPCTNDAGSCEYLDVVYRAHDLGMLYCGIIWATFVGILFIWSIYNWSSAKPTETLDSLFDAEKSAMTVSTIGRWQRSIASYRRQYLLPEFARPIFGRTTRLQVLVLAVLTGYLAVFSFVGIVYNTWVTPVKNMPGVHNTRVSLGPWADRVGVIAYALTPLSVLLSSRESILSLITGLPYQSFNFLHRWLGYIIVVQSILHTIGWSVVELRLYQPQPKVSIEWIKQLYMIWGVIAMFFLLVLFILSTPWAIRRTGYEFFRKSHYILAMVYIGACWGHWAKLSCFLIPGLIVWFIDRGVRLVRTGLLHYNYIGGSSTMGFQSTDANITTFPDAVNGGIVRLDFTQQQEPWNIGQHFYLCFPKSSIWQSHPFTPLNVPTPKAGAIHHSYIFRAKSGETKKINQIAAKTPSTPVILNGPYGVSEVDCLTPTTNILCIAGGTGITYVLPVLLSQITNCGCSSTRRMQLVWAIRRKADMAWVQAELGRLYEAAKSIDLKISIYVTREDPSATSSASSVSEEKAGNVTIDVTERPGSSSSSSATTDDEPEITGAGGCCAFKNKNKDIEVCSPAIPRKQSITIERRGSVGAVPAEMRHPDLAAIVREFVDETVQGSTSVYASGPGGMISDLRGVVAGCNDGGRVWRGDLRGCVELRCDDRLEW
ncbi:hypothetical protein PMZ80_004917 [Knufia obscura]|uniref:FAD-binding FR-type domain-containing protein n=1 Tax=Knufia obscura TaxID=1635080 RepID=A0ABR0RQJ6_9EURO|nr:hypothetical protein PMZ80_004917 [Knufia obscura]